MQSIWNFGLINTKEEQLKVVTQKNEKFIQKWKDREDYLSVPKVLFEALVEFDELQKNYGTTGDLGYYYGLRHAQNQSDSEINAKLNQIDEFGTKLSNKIQFFLMRLAKISPQKQREFLKNKELEPFKHFLEQLFIQSKYLLSEPEEKILNLKSTTSHGNWVKMTSTFLSKEKLEELMANLQSPDAKIREKSGLKVNRIMKKYVDVAENEMNSILYDKKIDDELRGIDRPDLPRHLADDIDSEVVDAMTEAVSSKFTLAHKFYELKAKMLGVSKLKYWDRIAPINNTNQKFSFEESVRLVSKVFKNLDPEFGKILEGYVQNGQIDVYPKKGKRGGAFCAIDSPTQPTYILLNHTDSLRDVLTLAHETGHGINNELMKSQKYTLNFGSPLSIAEVASTFMEDFVLQSLPTNKALLMKKLDDDIGTIFRQVACYNFEKELHTEFRKKNFLSKKEIGKLFQKHMQSYMGDFVEQNEGTENWWVYWSHIRSFFYVYSYSSGLLISKALQSRVKQNPKFIEKVKWLLAQGSSDSPKNLFSKLEIDITDKNFWLSGLNEVQSLLCQLQQ